jgi:hypothetical protein
MYSRLANQSYEGMISYINYDYRLMIQTPYIVSTLQPPATLVDPHLNIEYATTAVNRAKKKALAAEDGDVDMADEEPVSGPSKRCRRPVGGETSFWQTEIGIDAEVSKERSDHYGWTDLGGEFDFSIYSLNRLISDESNGTISDRDVYVKKAIWSPSGLSELGG